MINDIYTTDYCVVIYLSPPLEITEFTTLYDDWLYISVTGPLLTIVPIFLSLFKYNYISFCIILVKYYNYLIFEFS